MKSLNPSTSTKSVMTKLQNLFVALVNTAILQMILKFSFFHYGLLERFVLQHCEHIFVYAECLQMYAVPAPFQLVLNFP